MKLSLRMAMWTFAVANGLTIVGSVPVTVKPGGQFHIRGANPITEDPMWSPIDEQRGPPVIHEEGTYPGIHEQPSQHDLARETRIENAETQKGHSTTGHHEQHHGEQQSHGMKEDHHTGRVVATMMLMTVCFSMIILGMTQSSDSHMRTNTIMILDNVMAIFLAVLWFEAFDNLFDKWIHKFYHDEAALIHCLVWVAISFVLACALRKHKSSLAIFCGCGGHFVSFAAIEASTKAQDSYFGEHPVLCFFGFVVLLLIFAIVIIVLHLVKTALGFHQDASLEHFLEGTDEMETHFAGFAMSMYWTLFVLFVIVGEYRNDEDIKPGVKPIHTPEHRFMMLCYCIGMLVIGIIVTAHLPTRETTSYFIHRFVCFSKTFIVLCCAFAFLVWGKMQFYERRSWSLSPILARIAFAGVCTTVLILGIFLLVMAHHLKGSLRGFRMITSARSVIITSLGLLAALSWEETFDEALELAAGEAHSHILKGVVAIAVAIVVVPAYITYLKPLSLAATREEDEIIEEEIK